MLKIERFGLTQLHSSYQVSLPRLAAFLLLLAVVQLLAWLIPASEEARSIPNYLPLHTLMETVSIIVSMMVFAVGWNSRSSNLSGNIVLLACAFFSVGMLDFLHTVSYVGMPDFISPNSPNKQLDFWLSARLLAALTLLTVSIRPWRPLNSKATRYLLFASLLSISLGIYWAVMYRQEWFPDMFIPGKGLTQFKKLVEYVVIGIDIATALLLLAKMRTKQPFNVVLLFGAVCTLAMSEFFFTLYTNLIGSYNVLGHVYKAVAYLMIYRAIVVEVIEEPYEQLQQTQQDLSLALQASHTGLWSWDLRSNEVYFSKEWKSLLGYAPGELPNQFSTWESLLHSDDRERALNFVKDYLPTSSHEYVNEFRMRHRDGGYRWIEARGEKLYDGSGKPTHLVGSHIDITERKLAMEKLQEKNIELERYTHMVSHDLKSPLVTIKTFMGYLQHDMAKGDGVRVEKDIDFVTKAADKMGQLLDELLEMSRIGRVASMPQHVTFHEVVKEATNINAGIIVQQGVTVKIEGEDVQLFGDRTRLVQIWQNLIDNAVKFMGEQPHPQILIGAEQHGKQVVFYVTDNGIGVEQKYHEKIFGMFEKLDVTVPGSGLGLALVKRIVQLYRGEIHIESRGVGQGSSFRLTLPDALEYNR